jgi:hypothetical protein
LQSVNSLGNNCPPAISAAAAAKEKAHFQGFPRRAPWHDHRKQHFGLHGMAVVRSRQSASYIVGFVLKVLSTP